jgi:hypothetical protein
MNFRRGRTRVISNPCGYADENRYFDPLFTIEVARNDLRKAITRIPVGKQIRAAKHSRA